MSPNNPHKPMEVIQRILNRLGLTLSPTKTRELNSRETSFEFLDFEIGIKKSLRIGKPYPHVEPSKPALGAMWLKNTAYNPTRDDLRTAGGDAGECKPNPARLSRILSLPQLQQNAGKAEMACRRTDAHAFAQAP
jgi:hypothetical protein